MTALRIPLVASLLLIASCVQAADDKTTPARFIPAKNLAVLVEYDGLGAAPERWKQTAAYAVLNQTSAGEMLGSVGRQVVERLLKEETGAKITGADLTRYTETAFQRGFLFAVYQRENAEDETAVMILKGFGSKDARPSSERLLKLLADDDSVAKSVKLRGRELFQMEEVKKPEDAPADGEKFEKKLLERNVVPGSLSGLPSAELQVAPSGIAPASPTGNVSSPLPAVAPPTATARAIPAALPPAAPAVEPATPSPAPPAAVRSLPPQAVQAATPTPASQPRFVEPVAAPLPDDADEKAKKKPEGPKEVMTWWFEGDDLIIADGVLRTGATDPKAKPAEAGFDMVSLVLDAIEGKTPNAVAWPGRVAALEEGKAIKGFAANGLAVIESGHGGFLLQDVVKKVNTPVVANLSLQELVLPGAGSVVKNGDDAKEKPREEDVELKTLGLDRLKRVIVRWGFQDKALMTVVRFEIPTPRTGLLGLIDQPRLQVDRLPPIPKDAGAFAVGSFDAGKSYDTVVAAFKKLQPEAAAEIDAMFGLVSKGLRDATGQRLREDLLAHIGPAWSLYIARTDIWEEPDSAAPTLLLEVRDPEAFGKVFDTLIARTNDALRGPKPEADKQEAADAPALQFERLPAPDRGYRLVSPEGVVPWLWGGVQPTILLGKSSLVVAVNPEVARAALATESDPAKRWAASGNLAKTLALLPPGLTSLSVGDLRDSIWPSGLASLPRTVQYFGNILGASNGDGGEAGSGSAMLAMLGVPGPGGFRIKIDPKKVPRAAEIRALLFPSVLATVVDDRGLCFIGAEAMPFACITPLSSFKVDSKKTLGVRMNPFSLFR